MSTHRPAPDLIDLALERLEPGKRERLEAALGRDPSLEGRFRAIREHLAAWDALPPAPPPPPFARLEARLTRPAGRPAGSLAPAFALLLAAVVGGGLLLFGTPAQEREGSPRVESLVGRAGEGVRIQRGGRLEGEGGPLKASDRLEARIPAPAWLGDRVFVVLDGGASLVVRAEDRASLVRGRAYFEVAPGPPPGLVVETPHGEVEVRGTRFEVALREGGIEIRVEEGRVTFGGREIEAGGALRGERLVPLEGGFGAWFRSPRLELSIPPVLAVGDAPAIEVAFSNFAGLPVRIAGPDGVRTAFWLEVTRPGGEVLDLPLERASRGPILPDPGREQVLAPGDRLRVPLRVSATFRDPGTYRCRALYRPQHGPPLRTGGVTFEVR